MNRIIVAILLLVLIEHNTVIAQTFQWVAQFSGTSSEQTKDIAVDGSGNVFSTGTFGGTTDFDPGIGSYTLTSNGFSDIFISKLDSFGNLIWARGVGGTSTDFTSSIAIDNNNNVYVTGVFQSTVDFDPGVGTFTLTSNGPDVFVLKLDASGNFVWAKKWGDSGNDIFISSDGNVFITGHFSGTTDFNPGSGVFNLTSAGNADIFINELDSNGNFVKAFSFGGNAFDSGNSIVVDSLKNIYVAGNFKSTADFDPGALIFNLTSAGSDDIFICKFDSANNLCWAGQLGGALQDACRSLFLDNFNLVYVAGYFDTAADLDPSSGTNLFSSAGGRDGFFCKMDTSGNFINARQTGGANDDECYALTVDLNGNVFSTGYFKDTVDFDTGSGIYNISSEGGMDCFITKEDSSGNFKWTIHIGGPLAENGYSLVVDSYGYIYAAGFFSDTCNFSATTGNFYLYSLAYSDGCISKIKDSSSTSSINNFISYENNFSVYPNPVKNELYINSNEKSNLELSDVCGKLIEESQTSIDKIQIINVSKLVSGIYFIKAKSSKGLFIKKFIKE